jgi:ribosomal protein L22
MANIHILFYVLFLILLVIPSANSIGVNLKVTPNELDAVKGDISAVYIIRVIQERAKALKILKNKCSSTLPDADIENLIGGLAGALKAENKIPYLKDVDRQIIETSESHGNRLYWMLRPKPALHQAHVDFLKQIKLEFTLHFWSFKSSEFATNREKIHYSYKDLLDLNDATENVHKKIAAVLKWPQKKDKKFLTSLTKVAHNAKSENKSYKDSIF